MQFLLGTERCTIKKYYIIEYTLRWGRRGELARPVVSVAHPIFRYKNELSSDIKEIVIKNPYPP